MKYIAVLALLTVAPALAGATEPWLSPPNLSGAAAVRSPVSPSAVFELPASRVAGAHARLTKVPIVALEEAEVRSLGAGHFQCIYPEKPYLVRGIYLNGSTGGFSLQRLGEDLWVSHGSLGRAAGTHRSALLICLGFKPRKVFVSASGAL